MSRCRRKLCPRNILRLCRRFGTNRQQTISVNAGSEGPVTIDLHNVPDHRPPDALIVHLPPFPLSQDSLAQSVPDFLKEWPVASINYRWGSPAIIGPLCKGEKRVNRFRWPVPVHDTAVAFRWITEHLISRDNRRRNIVIYGSYIGASLATSLSLTESYPNRGFELTGLAAYNGIYNWTMFLPDHKINIEAQAQSATSTSAPTVPDVLLPLAQIKGIGMRLQTLFDTPSNLFDPFASPSLLFHNPGLLIPKLFHMTAIEAAKAQALTGYDKLFIKRMKAPPKAFLDFPPHDSELAIPDTLLMHDTHDLKGTNDNESLHDFRIQAEELVSFMRRSIRVQEEEENERTGFISFIEDEELHQWVQAVDIGEGEGVGLNRSGQKVLLDWLRHRF